MLNYIALRVFCQQIRIKFFLSRCRTQYCFCATLTAACHAGGGSPIISIESLQAASYRFSKKAGDQQQRKDGQRK